jgi:hypothetical protein
MPPTEEPYGNDDSVARQQQDAGDYLVIFPTNRS